MPWRTVAQYLQERLWTAVPEGYKIQKLTINAGVSCPNRDGTVGRGGCVYCSNEAFSPVASMAGVEVAEQLRQAREFFGRKYTRMKYLAYFQTGTPTHAAVDSLHRMIDSALEQPDVVGVIVASRPDCLSGGMLRMLADVARQTFVMTEIGAETWDDGTLRRIGRGHTADATRRAVAEAHSAGVDVGLHLIMGLPGENRERWMANIDEVNAAMPETVKFHQLQVLRGTPLGRDYQTGHTVPTFTLEEYVRLCREILRRIDPRIAIDRWTAQAPEHLLIAPRWGVKNHEFTDRLRNIILNDERPCDI